MKTRVFLIVLVSLGVTLLAQESAKPGPGDVVLPSPATDASSAPPPPAPALPTAADPAYMRTATAAFKATQADPEVQAAEERVRQVRAENALRLEEAELALELVRLRKGEATGVELTPIAKQRKAEIEARLQVLAPQLGRGASTATKTSDIQEAK
ncbi:MAG: hypothetical protein ACOZE5_18085 [Verrucomicrobiota bacterium]